MATLTIRLSDEKHARLKLLAKQQKISVNKLMDQLSTMALVEHDVEVRFRTQAARGDSRRGLTLLDKIDTHFGRKA